MMVFSGFPRVLQGKLSAVGSPRLVRTGVLAMLLMMLQACSGYSVKTDKDEGFAIGEYSSFRFADPVTAVTKSADLVNPLVLNRIRDAIGRELESMGLQQTPETLAADGMLIVDFTLQSEERVRYRPSTLSLGFGVRRGGLLVGGARDVLPEDYTAGRFAIELKKPLSNGAISEGQGSGEKVVSEVVWFGVANHNFLGMGADDSQKQVDKVVNSLLEAIKPSSN